MKINLVSLTMFSGGALLIYSGIKGYDPRSIIQWALGGEKPTKLGSSESVTPKVNPEDHPGDMPDTYPPGTEDGGEPTTPAVFV